MGRRPFLIRHATKLLGLATWVGAVALLPSRGLAEEEEAVRVFRQLKPSIVSFQNAEGSGTGFILQSDGLILTNAHVVASPLPYEVRVDSDGPAGKASAQVVFKRVQIIGYHPRLDMALVRIDPTEHPAIALKPVTRSPGKGEPGQRVYVIGDPGGAGKILAKSISSGMLSAVDREMDGEKYYQTDAAINHGNSGGPLCDRNGNILGMVTFKATDAESIGFAIPVNDLNVKQFVSLTQRKADPKQARELVDMAIKLFKEASDIEDREKKETKESNEMSYNAVMCLHRALSYDPASGQIFFDIGVVMQAARHPDIAGAYFARAIQLEPWDDEAGKYYVWLGAALHDQKQDDQAAIAWSEAVSKYPNSALGWSYLASHYAGHSRQVDAARCASIALMLRDPQTDLVALQKVADKARQSATARDGEAIMQQTGTRAIAETLDRMVTASNKARQARTLFMNKSCSALLSSFGGVPITDRDKYIPQTPLKPVAQWPTPTKAPANTRGPAASGKGNSGATSAPPGTATGGPKPATDNAEMRKIEIAVPATRNGGNPVASGVRLRRGQTFTLDPNPNDTWTIDKNASEPIDFRGAKKGSGRLIWKIGETEAAVSGTQTLSAPEEGELFFYCKDSRPGDNTGRVRVIVGVK